MATADPKCSAGKRSPCPRPAAGEIVARVYAAGVNPVDWKLREGYLKTMLPRTFPLIPGWDFSGVVAATGHGVSRLREGDAVYSRPDLARDGAYAEYIAVKETEVALKPRSIDYLQAAAVPLAA